jgi:hypothetical protein
VCYLLRVRCRLGLPVQSLGNVPLVRSAHRRTVGLKGVCRPHGVVGFGTAFGQCPRSASYHPGVAVTMSLLT